MLTLSLYFCALVAEIKDLGLELHMNYIPY